MVNFILLISDIFVFLKFSSFFFLPCCLAISKQFDPFEFSFYNLLDVSRAMLCRRLVIPHFLRGDPVPCCSQVFQSG